MNRKSQTEDDEWEQYDLARPEKTKYFKDSRTWKLKGNGWDYTSRAKSLMRNKVGVSSCEWISKTKC